MTKETLITMFMLLAYFIGYVAGLGHLERRLATYDYVYIFRSEEVTYKQYECKTGPQDMRSNYTYGKTVSECLDNSDKIK